MGRTRTTLSLYCETATCDVCGEQWTACRSTNDGGKEFDVQLERKGWQVGTSQRPELCFDCVLIRDNDPACDALLNHEARTPEVALAALREMKGEL